MQAVVFYGLFSSQNAFSAPAEYAECKGELLETKTNSRHELSHFASKIGQSHIILFGETHGNQADTQASSCVLTALDQNHKNVSLVLEILSRDDQNSLEKYRKANPDKASGLGAALVWHKRGWPYFENWLPLLSRAFSLRSAIYGGDLSAQKQHDFKIEDKQFQQVKSIFGVNFKTIFASWQAGMDKSYCGLIDDKEKQRLGLLQIIRDVSFATTARQALSQSGASEAAVLIHAGRGHVRKDRSLYVDLNTNRATNTPKDFSILSIAAFGKDEPITSKDKRIYDYIWVTQREMNKSECP
jgi:uncharacterized iron-regulated protein